MPQDIDRSLAIFYHPILQELLGQLAPLFNQKTNTLQINFIQFIEFNMRIQKTLLPVFDIANAFVSALNDWVKEVTECFNY